jgi:hypothetical protein
VHAGGQLRGRELAEVVHELAVPGRELEEAVGEGCVEARGYVFCAAEDARGFGRGGLVLVVGGG